MLLFELVVIYLFCLCLPICFTDGQDQLNVYEISYSRSGKENAYLMSEISQQESTLRSGLTFCTWTEILYFGRPTVIFSLKLKDSDHWSISLGMIPSGLLLKTKDSFSAIPSENTTPYLPMELNHFCLSITITSINIFHNGNRIHNATFLGNNLINENVIIYVGGGENWLDISPRGVLPMNLITTSFKSNINPEGSFVGSLIEPAVWVENLSETLIQRMYQCENVLSNSAVNTWSLMGSNIKKLSVDVSYPCEEGISDYFIFPQGLKFKENVQICEALGLNILTSSNGSYDKLLTEFNSINPTCMRENVYSWIHMQDNVTNRKEESVCQALTDSGTTTVISCEENLCSGCQINAKRNIFTLRGFCSVNKVDLSFVIQRSIDNSGYNFHGIEGFNIIRSKNKWVLEDKNGDFIASTNSSISLITTLQNWTFERNFCDKNKGEEVEGILTPCTSNEAICSTGNCIPFAKRCDGFPDCSDASDEEECETINFPENYHSLSPPAPLPTKVQININIIRILSLPPDAPMTLLIRTDFRWSDPRVRVSNIEQGSKSFFRNERLWRPKLSSINLGRLSLDEENFHEKSGFGLRYPRLHNITLAAIAFGKPVVDTRESVFADKIYAGENTTFSLEELLLPTGDCEFDFTFFPFDEHVCQLSLAISPWPSSRVVLTNPVIGRYTGPVKLLYYTIINTKFVNKNIQIDGEEYDGVVISIHFDRRTSLLVLIVYLPTIILIILNSSTLWMTGIQGTFARVQIGCIILIVIMLDWLLLAKYAPNTGHLTAIDAWLCFCTIFSLLHIGVHVLLDIFTEETEPDPYSRFNSRVSSAVPVRDVKPIESNHIYDGILNKVSQIESTKMWSVPYWILFIARVVSPVLLIFFNGAYWPFVLYFSQVEIP